MSRARLGRLEGASGGRRGVQVPVHQIRVDRARGGEQFPEDFGGTHGSAVSSPCSAEMARGSRLLAKYSIAARGRQVLTERAFSAT